MFPAEVFFTTGAVMVQWVCLCFDLSTYQMVCVSIKCIFEKLQLGIRFKKGQLKLVFFHSIQGLFLSLRSAGSPFVP